MKFEKVSKEAWIRQCYRLGIPEQESEPAYDNIVIPERATNGSCGYDFVCPFDYTITSDRTTMVPTGIRVFLDPGYFLMLVPRSSSAKRGYTMSNNVGIIDVDYVSSNNEGNIMVPLISTGKVRYAINFKVGEKIAQGIIVPFATIGDKVSTTRDGGFGSTDNKEEKDNSLKIIEQKPSVITEEIEPEEVINKDPEDPKPVFEEPVKEEEPKEKLEEYKIDSLFEDTSDEEIKPEESVNEEPKVEVPLEPERIIVGDKKEDIDVVEESTSESVKEEELKAETINTEVIAKEKEEVVEEEKPPVIMFNNHLSIYSNIINDTIVNELLKMIEFSKLQDPSMYVKFTTLKNSAKTINDIEDIYRTVNAWYCEVDNPDTLSDIYIRDAYIMFINRLDEFGEETFKKIAEMVASVRSLGNNGTKLTFGKEIYTHMNDKDTKKLYDHLHSVFNDFSINVNSK